MIIPMLSLLLSTSVPLPAPEPDGSRPVGTVAAFHGEPAPPAWLRAASHAAADPDCRHYLYEAYASADHWLARYVMLPEGDEAFREIEQVFLFPRSAGPSRPASLKPSDVAIDPAGATWHGERFRLVDRRDLLKP